MGFSEHDFCVVVIVLRILTRKATVPDRSRICRYEVSSEKDDLSLSYLTTFALSSQGKKCVSANVYAGPTHLLLVEQFRKFSTSRSSRRARPEQLCTHKRRRDSLTPYGCYG